jgi:succinyl-CoA synthetase alpha subunit
MAILIGRDTRILVQGITGREASTFTRESISYGAKVVAGVTPGRGGQLVHGVRVYDTVIAAIKEEPCDASIVAVPPSFAQDAVWEALDQGIRLIVIITERIPRRDVVAIIEKAASYGARVIGPNSLGIITPGQTRVGMCGGAAYDTRRAFTPGPVGLISRSGGMLTEIANMLTNAGLGQSTCVSIGGDPILGTTYLDLLPLYEADPDTRALVLFCEPGSTMEEQLANHLHSNPSRLPIVAFIAGRFTDQFQGMRFGHAGAIVIGEQGSPAVKRSALEAAGVRVAQKVSHIPQLIKIALGSTVKNGSFYSNRY